MRHVRVLGLCLIAAFAFAAIGSASASAGPVPAFWECSPAKTETFTYKKGTKEYTRTVPTGNVKECKKLKPDNKDKYRKYGPHPGPEGPYQYGEWTKEKSSAVKMFTGTSGKAFLEIHGVGPIECNAGTGSGKITGPQTVGDITVTFTGCILDKAACENTATTGEIVTKPLQGKLGFFDEKFKKPVTQGVGLDVYPESGLYLAEFLCEASKWRVTGSVIGEIRPPYNVFTTTFDGRYEEAAGEQGIESFEGMPQDVLVSESWSGIEELYNPPIDSGQSGELTATGEDVEIKT